MTIINSFGAEHTVCTLTYVTCAQKVNYCSKDMANLILIAADDIRYVNILEIEGLHERTEHLDIYFFHPSLNGVLFPMFSLLVEGECQILVL